MADFWNEAIFPALQKVLTDILSILPKLLAAILILLIGWLISRLLEKLIYRVLVRLGFDNLGERTGIRQFLKNAGIELGVSEVVAKLIFWMLILVFLLSAAETLELTALAQTLQKIVGFIPNLIAVVLILVFGTFLARLTGHFVRGAAADAGIEVADMLGKLVTNVILIAIIVIAISQLEIRSSILDIAFATLFGTMGLATALAIGLGTRQVSQNIIAGVYARKSFKVGQHLKIGDISGELIQIGTTISTIKHNEKLITIPNQTLLESATTIIEED